MSDKVSDFLLNRLSEWGIKRIYGYPGDGINGILGGLERNQDLLEFVQVRHEEMAAFTSGEVPTLPPHISFEQAKAYMSTLVKGDPEEGGVIKQSVKSVVAGIMPHLFRERDEYRQVYLESQELCQKSIEGTATTRLSLG